MKMCAAVVRAFGEPLSFEDREIPTPGPGQVLVKIAASGVCHTDLHAADGDWPVKPTLPFVPGHEGVGTVAATGASVTMLKEGDRVGVPWLHSACGVCEYCLTGWETLCERQQTPATRWTGATLSTRWRRPPSRPRSRTMSASLRQHPSSAPGVTTYKGLKETEARPGEWVVISGIGGLGHVAVQYARAMGTSRGRRRHRRRQACPRPGSRAEIVVNASHQDPAAEIQRAIGGAHGRARDRPSLGRPLPRPSGCCAAAGRARSSGCRRVSFRPRSSTVVLKRLTIRGSIVGTRGDLAEALAFAAHGHVKATVETQPLEAINDVFARLRTGDVRGRVVLQVA
jgi:propanol-preferring alcohol dehydrogenase